MYEVIFLIIEYVLSWGIAFTFIGNSKKEVLFHSCIAAGIGTLLELILIYEKISYSHELLAVLISLAYVLVIMFQTKCGYENALLLLSIEKGAESVLYGVRVLTGWKADLSTQCVPIILTILLFAIVFAKTYLFFPQKDWRSCFEDIASENKKNMIKCSHVYWIIGINAILLMLGFSQVELLYNQLVLAIVIAVFGFVIYWGTLWFVILMIEYRRENYAILAEKMYRDEMQNFINVIRSQRHDYNFHVQTLARMIHSGNLAESEKYINALVQDSIAVNMVLPLKDPAISAMINNFRTLAAREGVELHIDIQNDLSHIVTNVYETNKIIGNLLQNAIDETKRHQDKSYGIWLYILKRGEYCVIHVANKLEIVTSKTEYITNIYRNGYTTKQGHDGVGLSSIQTIAQRYKGVIYTRMEEDIIHFIAKIPIRYEENREDTYET